MKEVRAARSSFLHSKVTLTTSLKRKYLRLCRLDHWGRADDGCLDWGPAIKGAIQRMHIATGIALPKVSSSLQPVHPGAKPNAQGRHSQG